MDLEITYCQPCGHQPRAVELVNQLLSSYGMPLNKKLTIALKPSDGGIFDVALDGRLIFSKKSRTRSTPSFRFLSKYRRNRRQDGHGVSYRPTGSGQPYLFSPLCS